MPPYTVQVRQRFAPGYNPIMWRTMIFAVVAAACGGEKSPAGAAGSGSGAAPVARVAAAPDPTAELVRLEAKWQHLASDGPGDAFCKLGPEVANALTNVVAQRTAADPGWKGRDDAGYVESAMRRPPDDCNDALARKGRAAPAHILLSHSFTLEPLPYEVPADLVKKLEGAFAAEAPPTTDPAEGVKLVTAQVDAVCACQTTKCATDATQKVASLVMSMQHLEWTRELMDQLKAQSKRSHACIGALRTK
jgi:hypothetical protein